MTTATPLLPIVPRLGDYIADLTADEMRAVDKAISISLDTNHYYQTLQNMYNDKLQYIEK